MKAMVLRKVCSVERDGAPLEPVDVPVPVPGGRDVLVKVSTCGVCHTELDEIEGRTPPPRLPVIPGHQAVGIVEEVGADVRTLTEGDRVGIAWIYSSCGECPFCVRGMENLCSGFTATGRDVGGGYAEYMTVQEDFAHLIPSVYRDVEAAPLLCAGAIGYRSLSLARIENGQNLGLAGFGASAHLVLKLVTHIFPDTGVYVFARGEEERHFASELGATWCGDISDDSPVELDGIIDTTPVWKPVVEALKNLRSGGRLVINAIRKEELDKEYLLRLDYSRHLWHEKEIKSVANVTRHDVREFLAIAGEIPLRPEVEEFRLEEANEALIQLKAGLIRGAKVLRIA